MIILITKSELFTIDPDLRFARQYGVSKGVWKELWRRNKLLGYTNKELREYFLLKTGKQIAHKSMNRWIMRTEIYSKTKPVLDMGCESLNSNYFEKLEWFVIKELLKNLQSSVHKNSKILP